MKHLTPKGFTLVEVIIGVALVLIVFLGIFGAYQLAIKTIAQSKARIGAIVLAEGQIEKIRNLTYTNIGTYSCKEEFPECSVGQPETIIQGYPFGTIKNTSTTTFNNVNYATETRIDYTADTYDGVSLPEDSCPNDYKKVKVIVSWSGNFEGEIALDTIVAPKNLFQECEETGGILKVTVFDAGGAPIDYPDIEVANLDSGLVKTAAPENGFVYFSLPPGVGNYKITATKLGYSLDRTYGINEIYNGVPIAAPARPHATLIEGELTEISLSIDRLSSFITKTFFEGSVDLFIDSFFDTNKIAESSNIIIENGEVKLAKIDEFHYFNEGFLISETIEPPALNQWNEFNFTDQTPPQTKIRYQVLYFDGLSWTLVPDGDLSGNSAGLSPPPIDLDGLDPATYSRIRLKATLFSLGGQEATPTLYDWQATWLSSNPTSIGNVDFSLRGNKIIGTDAAENPIYKYSQNHQTDGTGLSGIVNMEWDAYTFTVDKIITGLDLVRSEPDQPVNLSPDTSLEVRLFLSAENSLSVIVNDANTAAPIFSASVRLYNTGVSYDKTLFTDEAGRTLFIPLSATTYDLEIQASGYQDYSGSASISGSSSKIIDLTPQ